jgi:hypothetical protein
MLVWIDGKPFLASNDVKVVYDDIIYGMNLDTNEDEVGTLQVTLTHEGVIADIIDEEGEHVGRTFANTAGELAENCI